MDASSTAILTISWLRLDRLRPGAPSVLHWRIPCATASAWPPIAAGGWWRASAPLAKRRRGCVSIAMRCATVAPCCLTSSAKPLQPSRRQTKPLTHVRMRKGRPPFTSGCNNTHTHPMPVSQPWHATTNSIGCSICGEKRSQDALHKAHCAPERVDARHCRALCRGWQRSTVLLAHQPGSPCKPLSTLSSSLCSTPKRCMHTVLQSFLPMPERVAWWPGTTSRSALHLTPSQSVPINEHETNGGRAPQVSWTMHWHRAQRWCVRRSTRFSEPPRCSRWSMRASDPLSIAAKDRSPKRPELW